MPNHNYARKDSSLLISQPTRCRPSGDGERAAANLEQHGRGCCCSAGPLRPAAACVGRPGTRQSGEKVRRVLVERVPQSRQRQHGHRRGRSHRLRQGPSGRVRLSCHNPPWLLLVPGQRGDRDPSKTQGGWCCESGMSLDSMAKRMSVKCLKKPTLLN